MRDALARLNQELVKKHPNYVARVVSDEGKEGRGHLDRFTDPEKATPVILTSSQMLTTGVDAPTCRNIVLFRAIGSMTEFKQIIGRGTRVDEDNNKLWFTILDYTGATQLFYDPTFDGDPVQVTKTTIDEDGNVIEIQDSEEGTLTDETPPVHPDDPDERNLHEKGVREQSRKFYLDGVTVYVVGEQAFELDPEENILRTVQFTDYARDHIRRMVPDGEHLRQEWPLPERRTEILNALRQRGIDPAHLAQVVHQEDADALDLLLHVAYNAPLVTRKERAAKLRQQKPNFYNTFTPVAQEILDALLEKYADFGVTQFDDLPNLLQIQPFTKFGSPTDIYQLFGGATKLVQAVDALQKSLYE